MNVSDMERSAKAGEDPPRELGDALKAMWLACAGDWDTAHELCQQVAGSDGAWIHAYLHRVEGDLGNASYWYGVAGKLQPPGQQALDQEWRAMVEELMAP